MNARTEMGFAILLVAMLGTIAWFLGWKVAVFAGGFAALWFAIAMVLLHRPPGVPEFVAEENDPDEQYVVRRDVIPRLPMLERIRWSLCAACGSCLLIWLTLTLVV